MYLAEEDKRVLRLNVYAARAYEHNFYHQDVSLNRGHRHVDWNNSQRGFVQ